MTVRRARTVRAPVADVWALVGDPYRLPAWWPRTVRVEGVTDDAFTAVLRSPRGRTVRADHRVTAVEPQRRRSWEQVLPGSPFERLLRAAATEVELTPAAAGTAVALTALRRLRGLNRLGAPMLRRAVSRELDEALAALAAVVE